MSFDNIDTIETSLHKARGILHGLMYDNLDVDDPKARHCAAWAAQGLLEDASDALEALVTQKSPTVKPAATVAAVVPVPTFDRDRFRRAVSLLEVLLEKTEGDDSGIQICDTLETAILELQAAGGLES